MNVMSQKNSLAHFAPILLDGNSGMGRVALHWRDAFERRGWIFSNYGIREVSMPTLKPFWGYLARDLWLRGSIQNNIFLAHEPVARILSKTGIPTVLFSHGLESRGVDLIPKKYHDPPQSFTNFLSRPFWSYLNYQREIALQKCPLLLLINNDDKDYAMLNYSRHPDDIFVFRNGVNPSSLESYHFSSSQPTILFYATWLERKGISVLIQAATQLANAGIKPRWLLVGTGKSKSEIIKDWPHNLHSNIDVRQYVSANDDDDIYSEASIFLLPSFYEGQPLTLLQAMESGRCVITTRCCGQKDIVKNHHNGLLFDPGRVDQLVPLLATALANEDLRLKLGFQAKVDMSSRRWSVVSDEVVDRIELFQEMNSK
jgi:glycosyltransferase involved in cell wall biosynthesis